MIVEMHWDHMEDERCIKENWNLYTISWKLRADFIVDDRLKLHKGISAKGLWAA